MIELLKARKYYGKGRTGWVVLVYGCPHHFTGPDALKQAECFADARIREVNHRRMETWLRDGKTWIGVFQNQDLGHPQVGRRMALPFADDVYWTSTVGQTKAPDTVTVGLGWRYVLIAKCRTVDEAQAALDAGSTPVHTPQPSTGA